jgi:four helix bundle protein
MNPSKYPLKQRTYDFALDIIVNLCRPISETTVSKPIVSQLIRSATSIGANYCEANNASSKKDFLNKIYICKKESQETKYWLKLLKEILSDKREKIDDLLRECLEFVLIFQKIISTMKTKN